MTCHVQKYSFRLNRSYEEKNLIHMDSRLYFTIIVFFSFIMYNVTSKSLSLVNDDDLLHYIQNEQYVVALFTKDNCQICGEYEQKLYQLREELVDALSTWVVKVSNSHLRQLYSPNQEPALVFFRNGIPLLYDGPLDDEEIIDTFLNNKEPVVKELTDDNFEHLTQASTGATTGDWFVMFYSNDCVECQRMGARWEAVGAKIKQRINVARVNKHTTGVSTARRFNVFDVPAFILFRQGKMYRHQIPKYDVKSLVSFAREWYRNTQGEKVPVALSPFDDFTLMIANCLRENPWIMKLGSIILCVVVVIVSIASKRERKITEIPEKKEK